MEIGLHVQNMPCGATCDTGGRSGSVGPTSADPYLRPIKAADRLRHLRDDVAELTMEVREFSEHIGVYSTHFGHLERAAEVSSRGIGSGTWRENHVCSQVYEFPRRR